MIKHVIGSFQKTSIPPPQRKLEVNPPLDVLIHLQLSETSLSPLPLRTAEISSVGEEGTFLQQPTPTKLPGCIYIC
jgi:hypothetical protein